MEFEGPSPRHPRKRSRSPSELGAFVTDNDSTPTMGFALMEGDEQSQYARQPKRRRKNKDIPDYHAPVDKHILERMERSNPLNRRNLKREAKRARKAQKAKMVSERGTAGDMEIDHDDLQFTFIA